MSERRTVYPFVPLGDKRDILIAVTIKAAVNSTKVFANSKKVFFFYKKQKITTAVTFICGRWKFVLNSHIYIYICGGGTRVAQSV